jgi:hypothetical protein
MIFYMKIESGILGGEFLFVFHFKLKNRTKMLEKIFATTLLVTVIWSGLSQAQTFSSEFPAESLPPDTPVGPDFNWYSPTDGPYPELSGNMDVWIDASLSTQRIHIMNGDKILYTMITSSGIDSKSTYTPRGTYHIQNRGNWFYASKFQEGAEYWVSWKGSGQYLFHSVPMNDKQEIISSAAAKLGMKASHGCFRLTVPDAKWIYENIPTGTKVVIHD